MDTRQKKFIISELIRTLHMSCNQYILTMHIASNRNEYQEHFLVVKAAGA